MFSIIICSISPERLAQTSRNIAETIGTACEVIGMDNRGKNWPIARVYNEGARRAQYPYLFFVHEDVKFHTQGWGPVIAAKLAEPACGVIGFAGSEVKPKAYSGWGASDKWARVLMYQGGRGKTYLGVSHVYAEEPFAEVVTVDGLGMFVRKEVWQQYPFDEALLTGFHCYDLDFSLQLAATGRYKNYVCCTPRVLIEHFSVGSYNVVWAEDTFRLHRQKWQAFLPLMAGGVKLREKALRKLEEKSFHKFVRRALKSGAPCRREALREFLRLPFSWKHLGHCIGCLYSYAFRYKTLPEPNKRSGKNDAEG